jgi:integrase
LLAQGIDPKKHREDTEHKQRFAHNNNFKSVFDEWFAVKETVVAIKQSKLIKRAFENHLFKELGNVPIGELKPQQVIAVVRKVEQQGKHDLAKRLCARINEVMSYAANTGRIETNSLIGITSAFKKVKATPNPAIEPKQLPWLLKIINAAELEKVTRLFN